MSPFEMEQRVRGSIGISKSGISFAGIDERVLVPNLVADMKSAFNAGRQAAYEHAARIAEEERKNYVGEAPPRWADSVGRHIALSIRSRALIAKEGG